MQTSAGKCDCRKLTNLDSYLSAFDFELPERLIALRPAIPRDSAKLLVVRSDKRLEDRTIRDLPSLLQPSDQLVFNTTKVLPAKLTGVRLKRETDGQDVNVTLNLIEKISGDQWIVLARPGRRLSQNDKIKLASDFSAEVLSKHESGKFEIRLESSGQSVYKQIEKYGSMPLPPYIDRRRSSDKRDKSDYQSEFATGEANSVAAPTASLHFSSRLLREFDQIGFVRHTVNLHVGYGTFAPLNDKNFEDNRLHPEWIELNERTAQGINSAKRRKSRVIAIGTTAMRTIESCANSDGYLESYVGKTNIFLKPGDTIRTTDGLLTNFHLPRSSLFLLVCTLMGRETMLAAYKHAIKEQYRFYSYGDACLLIP